jgi:hypothetical protein
LQRSYGTHSYSNNNHNFLSNQFRGHCRKSRRIAIGGTPNYFDLFFGVTAGSQSAKQSFDAGRNGSSWTRIQKTDLYFVGRLSIRTQWSNRGYDAKQYDEFPTFHCLPAHSLTRLPLG